RPAYLDRRGVSLTQNRATAEQQSPRSRPCSPDPPAPALLHALEPARPTPPLSTLSAGSASCWPCTSVLAGGFAPTYFARTAATSGERNSEMLVPKVVVLATWLKSGPRDFRAGVRV